MHFVPIQESIYGEKLADVYIREVVARNGVSISMVLDRDVRFTSRFRNRFHEELGTQLHFPHGFPYAD